MDRAQFQQMQRVAQETHEKLSHAADIQLRSLMTEDYTSVYDYIVVDALKFLDLHNVEKRGVLLNPQEDSTTLLQNVGQDRIIFKVLNVVSGRVTAAQQDNANSPTIYAVDETLTIYALDETLDPPRICINADAPVDTTELLLTRKNHDNTANTRLNTELWDGTALLVLWLASYEPVQRFFDSFENVFAQKLTTDTVGDPAEYSTQRFQLQDAAQQVLRTHFLHTLHTTLQANAFSVELDMPWEWRKVLLYEAFLTAIQDTTLLPELFLCAVSDIVQTI